MTVSNPTVITSNYSHQNLTEAIREGVTKLGKSISDVDIDDLAPVDEFHIGGRAATESFMEQLDFSADHLVLDVGCGVGGSSRFVANKYKCRLWGVDLTPEYVETGNRLCEWVGLDSRIQLQVGNATALPFGNEAFDRAFMMHVGMNIADKNKLATELFRTLRPGGRIGIYDVMKVKDGALEFPVPWATEKTGSVVSSCSEYKLALQSAGFHITSERNRVEFAMNFFSDLQAKAASAAGPPPLGLHILMGPKAGAKVQNMINNIERELIAPIELIAQKS